MSTCYVIAIKSSTFYLEKVKHISKFITKENINILKFLSTFVIKVIFFVITLNQNII